MRLDSVWPYALAGVLLLAVIILVLLGLLLRRAARASRFPEPGEPAEETAAPEGSPPPPAETPAAPALGRAFRRAARLLDRNAMGGRYTVPLVLTLGTADSRPADLLANTGLDLPFGPPADNGLSLGEGRGFWLLEGGSVLDVAGDAVLRADGKTADEREWKAILRRLQRLRPKRPADGLLLTLSCGDLLVARSEGRREELAVQAGRLGRKLAHAQKTLGFRLPVYVLVTGCERLPGFSSFSAALPPRLQGEILGWSSPYAPETLYRSSWVDEAFAALGSRLEDIQMEMFAEPAGAEADEIFQLPGAVHSLLEPLRTALDQSFKPSAYQESLALRGLYLCGAWPAEPGSLLAQRSLFVAGLLTGKVFPEAALAQPTAKTVLARNRAVLAAQAAAFGTALLFTSGLAWSWYRMERQRAELESFFTDVRDHVREIETRGRDRISDQELSQWNLLLLRGMSEISFDRFGSAFVPSSWFPGFNRKVESAVTEAFETMVLASLRRELYDKGQEILTNAGVTVTEASGAPGDASLPPEAPAVRPIEEYPEFIALRTLIDRLVTLEARQEQFNNLGREADLLDLDELVGFLYNEHLPPAFFNDSDLYREALHAAEYEPFQAGDLRTAALAATERLSRRFYQKLYDEDPLTPLLESLQTALQEATWLWPTGGDTAGLEAVLTRFHQVEAALAGPHLEWAFREEFDLGPAYRELLSSIRACSTFLGTEAGVRIEDAGRTGWANYQIRLTRYGSPLTRTLLDVQGGRARMQLSQDSLLLTSALQTFFGQGFVASAAQEQRFRVDLPANSRLTWDTGLLTQAAAVAESFQRFRGRSLALFPPDLQSTIDEVARDRTRRAMVDLIARAQRFEPVAVASSSAALEERLQWEITVFGGASKPVGDLLDAFAKLGADGARRDLAEAAGAEAFRLLRATDRLLAEAEPYRPRGGGFAWWNGQHPPSPAAWGARDDAEVAAYLEGVRARVALLAESYAQPVLSWLSQAGPSPRPEVRTLAGKWQDILKDLRDHEGKKPGNPVAALEEFITAQMPKVGTGSCPAAALPTGFRPGASFFAASLQDLSRQLSARCQALAGTRGVSRYAEMARYFNERLAGRYPFAEAVPSGPHAPEASPEDVRAFFRLYDAGAAELRAMAGGSGGGSSSALAFLEDVEQVRKLLAPFLDAEKPEPLPSFDLEVEFRVNREREEGGNEIIEWGVEAGSRRVTSRDQEKKLRWTLGEPVRLWMRWANDGQRLPFLEPRPGVFVEGGTVGFEHSNRWALLASLAEHRAPARDLPSYVDARPVTLGFTVPTRPTAEASGGEGRVRTFLRLSLLAPGTTQTLELPRFPSSAPRIDEPIVEEGL